MHLIEEPPERPFLDDLPKEIIVRIFDYLNEKDLTSVCDVSSYTRTMAHNVAQVKYHDGFVIDGSTLLRTIWLFADKMRYIKFKGPFGFHETFIQGCLNRFDRLIAIHADYDLGFLWNKLPKMLILSLNGGIVRNHLSQLRSHSALTVLSIHDMHDLDGFLTAVHVPTLEYIRFNRVTIKDASSMQRFVGRHQQLYGLGLNLMAPIELSGIENLINLRELEFICTNGNDDTSQVDAKQAYCRIYTQIASLESLQCLHVNHEFVTVVGSALIGLNQLTELRIDAVPCPLFNYEKTLDHISRMSNVKRLFFEYDGTTSTDKDLAFLQKKRNLRRFQMAGSRMTDELYMELVEYCRFERRVLYLHMPLRYREQLIQQSGIINIFDSFYMRIVFNDIDDHTFVTRAVHNRI